MIYRRLVTPLMYLIGRGDPERVHDLALPTLRWLGSRPLLSALVWRWYGSLLPRRTPVVYGLVMAAVVAVPTWWPVGWLVSRLPSPWAGVVQVAVGAWLYFVCWYMAACWWAFIRHLIGKGDMGRV